MRRENLRPCQIASGDSFLYQDNLNSTGTPLAPIWSHMSPLLELRGEAPNVAIRQQRRAKAIDNEGWLWSTHKHT